MDFVATAYGTAARAAFVSLRSVTGEASRRWQWPAPQARRWALEAAGTALYWGFQAQNTSVRCDSGQGPFRCCVSLSSDGGVRGNAGELNFGPDVSATFGSAEDIGFSSDTEGVGRRVARKEGEHRSESTLLCPSDAEAGWERFFELSEQVRTRCLLDAVADGPGAGSSCCAVGLAVQPLPAAGKAPQHAGDVVDPDAVDKAWGAFLERAAEREVCGWRVEAGQVRTPEEAEDLLRKLMARMSGQPAHTVVSCRELRFHCGCGEGQMALEQLAPLLALHLGDLEAWEHQTGTPNALLCTYCNTKRPFTLEDVERLAARARAARAEES